MVYSEVAIKLRAVALVATLIVSFVFVLALPGVSAYETVNRSTTYTFYTADGGQDAAWGLFSDGRYTISSRNVEAYSTCISVGYGATGWAEVWKTVNCGASGYYYTNMQGHYWAVMSAFGGATANVQFDLRIKDLSTGNVIATTNIYSKSVSWLGATNYQGDFLKTLIWYGTSGHQYGLELYVKGWTAGVVGSAIVDAAGDGSYFAGTQGAYYNYIQIGPYGGGGGCVLGNTQVLIANGLTKNAKDINVGDMVTSYDVNIGQTVIQSVTDVSYSRVNMIENINNGQLLLTPLDQPIWARNGTFEGWVRDPVNLTLGWQIFSPLTGQWMDVVDIQYSWGNYKVYEITTSGPNTFIGNGILLDSKTP